MEKIRIGYYANWGVCFHIKNGKDTIRFIETPHGINIDGIYLPFKEYHAKFRWNND